MTRDGKPRRTREFIRSETFVSKDGNIDYKVYRDRRARTIRLKWFYGDGLILTVPWNRVPQSTDEILRQNTGWLNHCRAKDTALRTRSGLHALLSGEEALYMGKRFPENRKASGRSSRSIRSGC